MTNSYFANPIIFLVDTLFYLYMMVVALRIVMQWAHWEYHNPLVQFLIRVTQAPVKLLRQFIPAWGRWDMATIVLLLLVSIIKIVLISMLQGGIPGLGLLLRLVVLDIFSLFITLFTASLIIEAILSWVVPPGSYNPVMPLLSRMNYPLLSPIRRILPPISGLDLSPLVALLALQVISMLVKPLLTHMA